MQVNVNRRKEGGELIRPFFNSPGRKPGYQS